MSDLIGWYLTELEMRLKKHLTPAKLEEVISESSNHLSEDVRRLISLGRSEGTAVRQALINYGSPKRIASAHLRALNTATWPITPRAVCAISAVLGTLIVLCILQLYNINYRPGILVALLPAIPIFVSSRQARRTYLGTLTISCLVATVGFIIFCSFSYVSLSVNKVEKVSRAELPQLEAALAVYQKRLENFPHWVAVGRRVFKSAKTSKDIPSTFTSGPNYWGNPDTGFKLPSIAGLSYFHGGVIYQEAPDFESAKFMWAIEDPNQLMYVRNMKGWLYRDQRNVHIALNGSHFAVDDLQLMDSAKCVAPCLAVQLLASVLGIVFIPLKSRWSQLVMSS